MDQDFAGRGALVVGGSGGLGAHIARGLSARGARVAVTYRRKSARIDRLLEEGVEHALELDVVDPTASAQVIDEARESLGGLDVLVHAAGPHVPMTHLSRVSPDVFRAQIEADVLGFFNVIHPALPHLRESKGAVVVITSAATDRYPVRDGLSAVPKGSIESLVRALAAEEGRFGVRMNSVGPGMLTDGMADRLISSGDLDERALQSARSNIPLRRFGTALDITEATCFLASGRAGFITGQKLTVDGGYTI